MKMEVPPPDKRLAGKVTILPFSPQRDVLNVASNAQAMDAESKPDVEEEIRRLARLDERKYELERKKAAKLLDIRSSALDDFVAAERNQDAGVHKQGRALEFADPDPWPEPVEGARLLNDLAATIRRYVVMREHAADAIALWVVHTYLVRCFGVSPRLAISSPEKGCGKTTLLDVLSNLVARPLPTANTTVAATFRIVAMKQPTLLIDEADTFLAENNELRGILNSGHRQGGSVIRTVGEDLEPRVFSTYSACAVALIGKLPATLADRSIEIELRRRRLDESIEAFRFDRTANLDDLARQAAQWAVDNADFLQRADPKMPAGVLNRTADNWRPLLAIADLVGGQWPLRARRAAQAASTAASDDQSVRVRLLNDIRSIFTERHADKMASAELVAALVGIEERPWAEWKAGKPITPNSLAGLLKPFGILPGTIRVGDTTPKGYQLAHFQDAFERYLPAHQE
jgi:putative DNA primase/helicase